MAPTALDPAKPIGPQEELRQTNAALGTTLRRRFPDWSPEADAAKGQVERLLAGLFDYQRIARQTLEPDWDRLSEGQQGDFVQAFWNLMKQALVTTMARSDFQLRFVSETVKGPVATVLAEANAHARPEERLEYLLAMKANRWVVYDVVVDGQSLVESYRSDFRRCLRRGGYTELMARLQQRLRSSRH